MKKKYVIEVTRIAYSTEPVEVIAENEHEAIVQAEELSAQLDYCYEDIDYEYSLIYTKKIDN